MINTALLRKYGAVEKQLRKGEFLFQEGEQAVFFYQILSGSIKMNNYSGDGKETIQGIFKDGDSFGEPAILGDFPFPANGEAVENSRLICLEKYKFLTFLKENGDVSLDLLKTLSQRLRFKAMLSKEVKGFEAEHQILTLLTYLKKQTGETGEYAIKMTRQTIANLTGLRVETVIRGIKKLEEAGEIQIRKRKIFI